MQEQAERKYLLAELLGEEEKSKSKSQKSLKKLSKNADPENSENTKTRKTKQLPQPDPELAKNIVVYEALKNVNNLRMESLRLAVIAKDFEQPDFKNNTLKSTEMQVQHEPSDADQYSLVSARLKNSNQDGTHSREKNMYSKNIVNDFLLYAHEKITENPLVKGLDSRSDQFKAHTLSVKEEIPATETFGTFFGTLIVYDSIKKSKINVRTFHYFLTP